LFQKHTELREGDLSRLRASLVNGEMLADIARELGLGDFIKLGSGELKSGGFRRASILADTVESILGAVYCDSDFESCRALILRLFENKLIRLATEKVMGIDRNAPMPKFSFETYRGWYKGVHQKNGALKSSKKVVYFHGCSANYYEPHIGKTVTAVLEHNGFEVIAPPQVCCGLPMLSNAEFDAARRNAHVNIDSLVEYARQGIPIVGASTSCILTLKSDYRHILDIHSPEAELVAEHTFDLCEFLLDLAEKGELRRDFKPIDYSFPYHAPCQLKAHGIGLPAIDLLELIPGVKVNLMDAWCCGVAGTYGYKKEKHQISLKVGRPLFEQIEAAGSPIAMCDSETCRWQIENETSAKLIHPVEVLAAAYGLRELSV